MKAKTLVVIAGPTAVGKTDIAIRLAQALQTAIISADSRQCYQGMAIGTAQPTVAQRQLVPHYFVDSFPVTQELTAADFEGLALGYLNEIFKERDTAIACGGTGLYLKALTEGLDDMPAADSAINAAVQEAYSEQGLSWLQQQVAEEDPLFYEQGEQQNPARLLRALIFKRSTGQSILQFRTGIRKERPFRILKLGLELPREVLYDRINRRVDEMMAAGFPEEARQLFPRRHLKNLQTVGYTELFDYLEGKISLDAATTLIRQHTRNYAKRQMTWFRKDSELTWFRADDPEVVHQMLAFINGHR